MIFVPFQTVNEHCTLDSSYVKFSFFGTLSNRPEFGSRSAWGGLCGQRETEGSTFAFGAHAKSIRGQPEPRGPRPAVNIKVIMHSGVAPTLGNYRSYNYNNDLLIFHFIIKS